MRTLTSAARALAATALTLLLALPLSAPDLSAQGVRYTETTRVEMGGMMGSMMSMMGGLDDPTTDTVYLEGSRMRRDGDGTSSIVDWSSGEMILLDHESRTFMRMTWADMQERMSGAVDSLESAREQARDAAEDADAPDMQWETKVSTERTGRTEEIDGYDAEQVVMVMELQGKAEMEEQGEENPFAGLAMAVVTEMWMSTDFPAWAVMRDARDDVVATFRGDANGGGGMAGMGAMDPRIAVAMEEQQKFMEDMDGMPLRTVMSFVTRPPDTELDVEAVLETEELGEGMGGLAAAAAQAGIRDRLGGLFGGGGDDEEEGPETSQSIFMRTTSEVEDVDTATLDDTLFQVPQGYTERAMPAMPGR